MSETISYSSNIELQPLFDGAAKGDAACIEALCDSLKNATPAICEDWSPAVAIGWVNGLDTFAKNAASGTMTAAAQQLALAMLNAGLDSAAFRSLYRALATVVFAKYENPDGLATALGLTQEDVRIAHIAQKWRVMEQLLAPCKFCYERALGIGEIIAVDCNSNEVKIQDASTFIKPAKTKSAEKKVIETKTPHRRFLTLRSFLENVIVVKHDSDVEKWLDMAEPVPAKIAAAELEALVRGCIVTATNLPMNLTRALLVPRALSDTKLKNIIAVAPAAAAQQAATTASAASWEKSRSILELSERLKTVTTFSAVDEESLANVDSILKNAALRDEHAELFAFCLAILQEHSSVFGSWLANVITADLADAAVVWANDELFADTCDKLPVKQVPAWLEATLLAKGPQYLVEHAFTLPFKLWTHAEKLLAGGETANMFHDLAEERLKEGKTTADLLFWVWKSKYDDLKKTYLTNAPLIFKTLMKEVKGSYLKAQRDIHRMLLSDKNFQIQVMNGGEEAAVASLVRCTKRMTLLDASERQSLLVQIVRIFPEYLYLVEERRTSTMTVTLNKISSIRSIKARQQELEHIINKLIPENTKAIEVAREHGDLRENSEFKFAKERQRFLNARRSEFERSLQDIRGTDFRSVELNGIVVPGCTVVLHTEATNKEEAFHVLGLLDTMPEKNIISFDTPLGKVLISHRTGDHIDLPNGQHAIIREIKKLDADMLNWLSADPDPIVDEPAAQE